MPISCQCKITRLSQAEFQERDYEVMRYAFACHNDLGRFYDEIVYQRDFAARLADANLGAVVTELPVILTHGTFQKMLYCDLLVSEGVIYELKAASAITGGHQKQMLNYLLLLGLNHGKILNFRPESLEHHFVSTSLDSVEQRRIRVCDDRWQPLDSQSENFKRTLLSLLSDWGVFLDLSLYLEALVHLFGGEENVLRLVDVLRDGKVIASQRMHLLSPEVAFKLTAFNRSSRVEEHHLRRVLAHTPLKAIHWVNFNRHKIEFVTLSKKSFCQLS